MQHWILSLARTSSSCRYLTECVQVNLHHIMRPTECGFAQLQIRRRHLHPHNELLGATADALADAFAAGGDVSKAAEQCAVSLEVIARSYGPHSTAAAHCKLKLAGLLRQAGSGDDDNGGGGVGGSCADRADKLRQDAAAVLALHHGSAVAVQLSQL